MSFYSKLRDNIKLTGDKNQINSNNSQTRRGRYNDGEEAEIPASF